MKYGCKHPAQNVKVIEKFKNTCLERYDHANPMQSEVIRNRQQGSLEANHGVRNPQQSKEIKDKTTETIKNKYGTMCKG